MPIPVQKPVTVNGETITFDTLWMSHMQIQAFDPNKPVRVMATVEKVKANEDGTYTKAPQGTVGARGNLMVNDIFDRAAKDAVTVTLPSTLGGQGPAVTLALADIMTALLLKVKQMAEAEEVI